MEVARIEPADIDAVHAQRTILEVVDAQEDIDQSGLPCGVNGRLAGGEIDGQVCGLTRTVVADDGEGLARFDGQIDVVERRDFTFEVVKTEVPF